ncbi:MAG: amino acid ABC transporter permease [Hyphomicrobiales bacterium]|nr:amino acid ABC transporter permease [Hyphomicrobiales bacterium]
MSERSAQPPEAKKPAKPKASRDVILAGLPPQAARQSNERWGDWGADDFTRGFFTRRSALIIIAVLALAVGCGEAYAQLTAQGSERDGVLATMLKWAPLILFGRDGELGGFALNIVISFLVMAIGTVTGVLLGIAQVSTSVLVRKPAWAVTQFFRNSPWLVLLFFTILLMPFQIRVFGYSIPFPDWIKATIGLALPIMANISEVTRGAIQSIPTGQWESSESLAFSRSQQFRLIILPQCVKRMTPPWMNWYAILTMATSLVSIVGVSDAMTLTKLAVDADGRSELLIPMYGMLLMFFFLYCYPIARLTQVLERRYAVVT